MTGGVYICCRCDNGIQPDQRMNRHVHDRPSGPPVVTYSHRDGCDPNGARLTETPAAHAGKA